MDKKQKWLLSFMKEVGTPTPEWVVREKMAKEFKKNVEYTRQEIKRIVEKMDELVFTGTSHRKTIQWRS